MDPHEKHLKTFNHVLEKVYNAMGSPKVKHYDCVTEAVEDRGIEIYEQHNQVSVDRFESTGRWYWACDGIDAGPFYTKWEACLDAYRHFKLEDYLAEEH